MMISFNELYFVTSPNPQKTWGIDPKKFPDDFIIVAKQLRSPITKDMMVNMRNAELKPFSFIALGTEIN